MTGDAYQKAAGNRGAFEEILSAIPGFQGYLKQEHRREADRLHREHLAKLLDQAREKVREAVEEWTDENRFANLERGDKTQNQLQKIASTIKNADAGYSGFFDTVQIGDKELEMLYEIDRRMLGLVEDVRAACDALDAGAEDGDGKKQLKAIEKAVDVLEETFSKRKDTISGVI